MIDQKNSVQRRAPLVLAVVSVGLLLGHGATGSDLRAEEATAPILVAQNTAGGAAGLPCDPIMLSGMTGECAGTGDPLGFAGDAEMAGLSEHPLALELSNLPKDRYGLIDWATAIKEGKVKPLDSLDPKAKVTPPFDLDIAIFTKSQFQPDVIFPHFVHTLWLTCTNCHPSIFPMNAKLANKMMTMPLIASGEFCGRCHNRIAFPLSDCLRCHVKPKDTPPIDPNYKGVAQSAPR